MRKRKESFPTRPIPSGQLDCRTLLLQIKDCAHFIRDVFGAVSMYVVIVAWREGFSLQGSWRIGLGWSGKIIPPSSPSSSPLAGS